MLGWANTLGEYPENATTCSYGNGSYGNYANLQLAQMAQVAQQRVTYPADYWKRHAGGPVPGPILGRHFESVVVDDLIEHAPLSNLVKMSEPLDDPPDPFRQLCNHDFHALLDKFRKMGVA